MRTYASYIIAPLLGTLGAFAACDSSTTTTPDGGATTGGSTTGGTGDGGDPGVDNSKPRENVTGDITADRTLTNDKNYVLNGVVFVKSGATLTIEKGTTLFGDNASKAVLVVQPGAKIIAEGTAEEPIVFTSQAASGFRRAGDWGGVVILGKAPVNQQNPAVEGLTQGGQYGGNDPADDSGVLKWIRIEYAGVLLSPNNEVNGLTFAGVGNGTVVEHILVRHALDDCFEFFGGTVNAKYLGCQYNQDDGFDWDYGYSGKLQYLVYQADPNIADDCNGFEADNDVNNNDSTPYSNPTIYNVTLIGKNKEVSATQLAMNLRRGTKGTIRNLIALGFEAGMDVRDKSRDFATDGSLSVRSTMLFGMTGSTSIGSTTNIGLAEGAWANLVPWFTTDGWKNTWNADPGLEEPYNANAPKFGPATSLTENAETPPNDGFFDTSANFQGAFKDRSDNWATEGNWGVWTQR